MTPPPPPTLSWRALETCLGLDALPAFHRAFLSWRALETCLGLDALPAFHRAFLSWRGVPEAAGMPLRRVQQRVEAELNRLVQAGHARREDDDWVLDAAALAAFAELHDFPALENDA